MNVCPQLPLWFNNDCMSSSQILDLIVFLKSVASDFKFGRSALNLIPPALATSSNHSDIPLMISSSPSGRISTVFKGGRASRAEGPPASPGLQTALGTDVTAAPILPCRNPCRCGVAGPRLSEPWTSAFTWSGDWVTPPDQVCQWRLWRRWRRLRARVGTKGDSPWGPNLQVARCVTHSSPGPGPFGSSLPEHDEILILDVYMPVMPQANVYQAEPPKQAMWNGGQCTKAGSIKCQTADHSQREVVIIWRKFCCGNPQQEFP